MLPGFDGFEVLRRIRARDARLPVLLLTAKGEELDRVLGLELGADDYITKPFSVREVLARIKAVFRRAEREEMRDAGRERYDFGDLVVDLERYEVTRFGKPVDLTPKEYELLAYLVRNRGRALTREQLVTEIWNFEYVGDSRIVDVHVSHLREKSRTTRAIPSTFTRCAGSATSSRRPPRRRNGRARTGSRPWSRGTSSSWARVWPFFISGALFFCLEDLPAAPAWPSFSGGVALGVGLGVFASVFFFILRISRISAGVRELRRLSLRASADPRDVQYGSEEDGREKGTSDVLHRIDPVLVPLAAELDRVWEHVRELRREERRLREILHEMRTAVFLFDDRGHLRFANRAAAPSSPARWRTSLEDLMGKSFGTSTSWRWWKASTERGAKASANFTCTTRKNASSAPTSCPSERKERVRGAASSSPPPM